MFIEKIHGAIHVNQKLVRAWGGLTIQTVACKGNCFACCIHENHKIYTIPLTSRVRGPYGPSAKPAEDRHLQYGLRKRG